MIDIEDQIEYFYGFFKFERTMKELKINHFWKL